jgi:hypothetical protein
MRTTHQVMLVVGETLSSARDSTSLSFPLLTLNAGFYLFAWYHYIADGHNTPGLTLALWEWMRRVVLVTCLHQG